MLSLRFPVPSMNTLSPYTLPSQRNELNLRYSSSNAFPMFCKVKTRASHVPVGRMDRQERLALPEGLKPELMPKHVAIIMDGHRGWAKEKGLPVQQGHEAGCKAMKELACLCSNWGIKVLTVFGFSTENWTCSKEEVDFLASMYEEAMRHEIKGSTMENIKASAIGNKSGIPKSMQNVITLAEEQRKSNKGFNFVIAFNYGGRYDILQASRNIASKVKDGLISVEDIDENLFQQELETKFTELSNPDLLIRTSGEIRISNFLLWQLAYTELYFTKKTVS